MIKRLALLTSILSFHIIFLFSQTLQDPVIIRNYEANEVLRFDVFSQNKWQAEWTPGIEMKLYRTYNDTRGKHHDRYHQYYKDKRVIGASVVVHSEDKFVQKITGVLQTDLKNVPEHPDISDKLAIQIATLMMAESMIENQKIARDQKINPTTEEISLCVIYEDFPNNTGKLVLAYEIIQSLSLWKMPYKMAHYVNASTGQPIKSIDKIMSHSVKGRGLSNYYGPVIFDHDSIAPDEFHLRDYSRGKGVFIRNSKTSEGYINDSGDWSSENSNDKAAIDVMYGAQHFYDLLFNRFQFNSLDNEGYPLIGNVNNFLSPIYYWDGISATFGGGDCHRYNSTTYLDIVGHEFAHGLTQFNSNLGYSEESNALSESISDIFGKALEFYVQPNQFSWNIGSKISKLDSNPVRSMSNPNLTDQPKYYKGNYWSNHNFGYINSGVLNFWYYLLVKGGNGSNEKDVVYYVKPIGMDKALEMVFLLNTVYLTETSTFADFYEYSKSLAEDLYGPESTELKAVLEAFKAVGLPVEVPDNELILEVTFNGSAVLNPFTCWEEQNSVLFTYKNTSNVVIPEDASVHILIIGQYNDNNEEKNDILFNDYILLTDSIRNSESFDLNVNFTLSPAVGYVTFTSDVIILFPGTTHQSTEQRTIQFKQSAKEPKDLFKGSYLSSNIANICDEKSSILRTYSNLQYFDCKSEDYIFEFEYTFENTKVIYFDTAQAVVNRILTFASPGINNPDLSMFDRTSDILVHLFVWIGAEKYYIMSDTLAKRFPKPIVEHDTIHFNQLTEYRHENRLKINPGIYMGSTIVDQTLRLKGLYGSTNVDDCIPLEDFYVSIFDSPTITLKLSKITGCVNSEQMIQPYLSMDLNLYTSRTNGDKNYRHGLLVYENGIQKTSPAITHTGPGMLKVEIPIASLPKNKIDLEIYLDGAEATFDNIFVFDKSSSSSKDVNLNMPVSITNPATDFITVRCKQSFSEVLNLQIYNVNGKRFYSANILNEKSEIDCSNWPSGFYTFTIKGKNNTAQGKLIVVR